MSDSLKEVESNARQLAALVGIERGRPVGAVGRYRDAASLAAAFAPVFDESPDLVGITDDAGLVAYLNPAARERFGIAELDGFSVERIYASAALDLYYREIRPVLLTNHSWLGYMPMRVGAAGVLDVGQSITAGVGIGGETIEWLLSVGRETAPSAAGMHLHRSAPASESLAVGDPVEVQTRSHDTWSRGFVVERREPEGYLVRRTSDHFVLPLTFDPAELRPARSGHEQKSIH